MLRWRNEGEITDPAGTGGVIGDRLLLLSGAKLI